MARVKYIGTKPHGRADTVAGTGVVWLEPGDVQEVADPKAVILLLRYKDIWQLETPLASMAAAAPAPAPKPAELPVSPTPAQKAEAEKPAKQPAKGAAGKGKKAEAEKPSEPPKYVLEGDGGVQFVLDTMDDAQLAAFGKDFGLTWQADLTGDALRAALYEAATAETAKTDGAESAKA